MQRLMDVALAALYESMNSFTHDALSSAHSFLFVPANRPERIAKAFASGAHVVVVDLEDAVAPTEEDVARDALANAWTALTIPQRQRTLVRINATGSLWHDADVTLVASLAVHSLGGVMLPKCESPCQVDALALALPLGSIVPLIESAVGLHGADAIAHAARVVRIAFGHLDFQVDIGMHASQDEQELLPVRLAIVLASRCASLAAPIDGVTTVLDDVQRLAADSARSRRIGFRAKLCIHPRQVDTVSQAFCATPAELAWARRVIQASEQHGLGAFTLDGRMVDAPVLPMARDVLGLKPKPGFMNA